MPLFILGINHNTAPVHIRETVVFDAENQQPVLNALRSLPSVAEAMLLSTCNRTEIVGAGTDVAVAEVKTWLVEHLALNQEARESLFAFSEADATRHLCRVAAGLDSAILGEPQIAGQLKDAFRQAQEFGAVGPELHRLCQHAFSTAKQIRTETAIGENPVSVAYAAVSLAGKLLDRFERQTALLVGAGETIQLVARHLRRAGIGRLFVANRTLQNAEQIAQEVDGVGLALDALPTMLPAADIIVSSTASPEPVIDVATMRTALAKRRQRQPMFIADIAVPRDIEPGVRDLSDVYLYTVDDLQGVITESLAARQQAAVDAESLISAAVQRFNTAHKASSAGPLIRALRSQAESTRDELLAEANRRMHSKSPEDALNYLANALTNKLLHAPSESLREAAANEDIATLDAARRLFQVEEPEE